MTVSFIIVAYNAASNIQNLLRRLNCQDYPHHLIEVILVDSNSTDDTKALLEQFASLEHSFMRIIIKSNPMKTLPCGWNVALSEATNDILIRIDAHATIPDNFISINVKTLENGENICGGKVISISDTHSHWKDTLTLAENSMFGGSFAKFRRLESAGYVSTLAFAAYKKDVFDKVGRYNEALARTEDNEMHYRMKCAGYRFYYNPEIQSYRENRNTLIKLIKQKYLNGYWIGLTLSVCAKCFSLYHFVPFMFVLSIIGTVVLSILGYWQYTVILWSLYGIFAIMNTIFTLRNAKEKAHIEGLSLPILFLSLHLSYGIGTLFGIIKIPFWFSNKNKN